MKIAAQTKFKIFDNNIRSKTFDTPIEAVLSAVYWYIDIGKLIIEE